MHMPAWFECLVTKYISSSHPTTNTFEAFVALSSSSTQFRIPSILEVSNEVVSCLAPCSSLYLLNHHKPSSDVQRATAQNPLSLMPSRRHTVIDTQCLTTSRHTENNWT
jgi:hypothetical protein